MSDRSDDPGAEIDPFVEFKEILAEQTERQGRLRHVQQFLSSPQFVDLRDQTFEVSDPPEAIEERKRDLDYRIRVLESLLVVIREERASLDKAVSAAAQSPDGSQDQTPDDLAAE